MEWSTGTKFNLMTLTTPAAFINNLNKKSLLQFKPIHSIYFLLCAICPSSPLPWRGRSTGRAAAYPAGPSQTASCTQHLSFGLPDALIQSPPTGTQINTLFFQNTEGPLDKNPDLLIVLLNDVMLLMKLTKWEKQCKIAQWRMWSLRWLHPFLTFLLAAHQWFWSLSQSVKSPFEAHFIVTPEQMSCHPTGARHLLKSLLHHHWEF